MKFGKYNTITLDDNCIKLSLCDGYESGSYISKIHNVIVDFIESLIDPDQRYKNLWSPEHPLCYVNSYEINLFESSLTLKYAPGVPLSSKSELNGSELLDVLKRYRI